MDIQNKTLKFESYRVTGHQETEIVYADGRKFKGLRTYYEMYDYKDNKWVYYGWSEKIVG
jgi:hypothetical protein